MDNFEGLSGLAARWEAEVPPQDAELLAQLADLYAEKARIEARIFHLIRQLCPDGAGS